jgi:hypothetical protein
MTENGASPLGFHYLNEYLRCPRKWYIHHILGLEDAKPKPALLFGKVWHQSIEMLLSGKSLSEAFSTANGLMWQDRPLYPSEDEFKKRLDWLKGLEMWEEATQRELKDWTIENVEDEFDVELAEGFHYTGRSDGWATSPDGKVYLLEHKTTTYGVDRMLTVVDYEDQVTGYILGMKLREPERPIDGVLLDVAAFKTHDIDISYNVVTRCQEDLVNYHLSLVGLFKELDRKRQLLTQGGNPFELFPRNGSWCGMFGCPYATICRRRLEQLPQPITDEFVVAVPSTKE